MEFHQKSRFVNNLAMISIVIGIYMIYQDISNLSMLQTLSASPEYKIAEQMMPSMSVSPAAVYGEIFLYVLGIAASIAMIMRLQWGRVMYIVILFVTSIWGIIASISSYLSLSQYLDAAGMGNAFMIVILGNVLIVGINVFIIWKLSTAEIRSEFT
jgi:hypothetical protein